MHFSLKEKSEDVLFVTPTLRKAITIKVEAQSLRNERASEIPPEENLLRRFPTTSVQKTTPLAQHMLRCGFRAIDLWLVDHTVITDTDITVS